MVWVCYFVDVDISVVDVGEIFKEVFWLLVDLLVGGFLLVYCVLFLY